MKILVVDDSTAMRMIVKKMLKEVGINASVSEASDGSVAYEHIKEHSPHLVLCDWNMPNMTGIELLEKLTEEGIAPKFGFITTEATDDMRKKAKEEGASFFITKPFTEDTFREGLSFLL